MSRYRVGIGYDLHQLAEGRKLILGGIQIDHTHGLKGHSDADCLTHAIIDSLLGAAGLEDIGHFFPDTDIKYKDIDSQELLKETMKAVRGAGYEIVNVDSVVIAEAPKLYPYIKSMKAMLAKTMEIEIGQLGVKATTNEGMDSIGEQRAIAAQATCMIELLD